LRVQQVDGAHWLGEARLALGGPLPALEEGIASVAPVPFRDEVTIVYALERDGVDLELNVHDIGGRLVRSLAKGPGRAGRHRARWDGRDSRGQPVAAGIYFVTLRLGEERFVRKIVLLP
jgi:flagellar hook assembly protein FlgD